MRSREVKWNDLTLIAFVSGESTAFGIYDNDTIFTADAQKVLRYVIRSLGYPQMEVLLTPLHIYTAFLAAAMKYSTLVNQAKISDNLLNVFGQDLSKDLTKVGIYLNVGSVFLISSMYGQEAIIRNSLHLDIHSGTIMLKPGVQLYDLKLILLGGVDYDSRKVQITEVYHYASLYANQGFDPMINPEFNMASIMSLFGGVYSMNARLVVMPIFLTLLKMQALLMSQQIRRSEFGFLLRRNKILFYPMPQLLKLVCILYILKEDKISNTQRDNVIDTVMNFPIKSHVEYSVMNVPARNWIQRYTLALCKLILGLIRSKYSSVPYPLGLTSLDGLTLRTLGQSLQEDLVLLLKFLLLLSSMYRLVLKKKLMALNILIINSKVPLGIYIG